MWSIRQNKLQKHVDLDCLFLSRERIIKYSARFIIIIITKWLYCLKIEFVFIVVDRKNPKDWQDLASPHQSQKLTRSKLEPRGESSSHRNFFAKVTRLLGVLI